MDRSQTQVVHLKYELVNSKDQGLGLGLEMTFLWRGHFPNTCNSRKMELFSGTCRTNATQSAGHFCDRFARI